MSLPYRVAVALVVLMASLAFVIIMWDDDGCAPEPGDGYQFNKTQGE